MKLRHEHGYSTALLAGVQYARRCRRVGRPIRQRALGQRLLVHDKVIAPMPEEGWSAKTIRHRLAAWYAHQLPKGHPLLEP